jgi:hypothetical protein
MAYNGISEKNIIGNPSYSAVAEYVDSVINYLSDSISNNVLQDRLGYDYRQLVEKAKTLLDNLFVQKGLSLSAIKDFSFLRVLDGGEISDFDGISIESEISNSFGIFGGRTYYNFDSVSEKALCCF